MKLIDHIRLMSTEELAEWLCMALVPDYEGDSFLGKRQKQEIIKHLEQEVI